MSNLCGRHLPSVSASEACRLFGDSEQMPVGTGTGRVWGTQLEFGKCLLPTCWRWSRELAEGLHVLREASRLMTEHGPRRLLINLQNTACTAHVSLLTHHYSHATQLYTVLPTRSWCFQQLLWKQTNVMYKYFLLIVHWRLNQKESFSWIFFLGSVFRLLLSVDTHALSDKFFLCPAGIFVVRKGKISRQKTSAWELNHPATSWFSLCFFLFCCIPGSSTL